VTAPMRSARSRIVRRNLRKSLSAIAGCCQELSVERAMSLASQ